MYLSVVIPIFNEEDNIAPLIEAVEHSLQSIASRYEIIFVDDGSTDSSVATINRLAQGKSHIRVVAFTRNFGQTSAMAAGIEAAHGEYITTLDGDLQNDPSDILLMLKKLEEEKLDIVAGRRANRQDGMLLRKIPSKIANKLIRKVSNLPIHDYGCTLKVFRAERAKNLGLYGELHRFIPILAHMHGARIAEMDVKHHPRKFGVSKYGLGRTFKVMSDVMLMVFFLHYRQRPMHLFGTLGLWMFFAGTVINAYLLLCKLMGEDIGTRPLFFVGIVLLITSIQLITTGFIAELLMRTYYAAEKQRPYHIAGEFKGGERVE